VTRRASRNAALWLALLTLGQAATLQLTSAGPSVHYQHLLSPAAMATSAARWAPVVLLIEVLAVAVGLGREWPRVRGMLRTALPGWRLPVAAAALALTSATVSRAPAEYAVELILATLLQLAHLGAAVLAGLSLAEPAAEGLGRRVAGLLGSDRDGPVRFFDKVAVAGAAWTVVVSSLLVVFSYQRHPHVPDEVVYLLHAKYFAAGMLWMQAPPVPDAFDLDLMVMEATRWFSPVPPGWPAVLAIGVKLGAPWLVNPVLGGLSVLLAHAVVAEVMDRRTARVTVLLMSASPWHLFVSMSLLGHEAALACALGAALGVVRLRAGRGLGWAVLGGISLGLLSLVRPLEGLVWALLLGAWSLGARGRAPLLRFAPAAVLTATTVAVGAIQLWYNQALTGRAGYFPITLYTDRVYGPHVNDLGFGASRGLGWGFDPFPGHGPLDVVVNTNLNVTVTNVELLGWACGSMVALLLLLAGPPLRRRGAGLMLGAIGAVVGVHAFYWFSGGPDFGARYWYLIIVPALALAARGLDNAAGGWDSGARAGRVAIATVGLSLAALSVFVPWRAADKYHHYRGMRPDVRALAAEHGFGRSLVLVRGRQHPDFAGAAAYNPVDLSADAPIYAWERDEDTRRRLLAAFPDRPVWLLEGLSATGGGYRLTGPLARDPAPAPPGRPR